MFYTTADRIRAPGIAVSSAPGKRSLLGGWSDPLEMVQGVEMICVYNIYLEYIVWYVITVIYCVQLYIYTIFELHLSYEGVYFASHLCLAGHGVPSRIHPARAEAKG